MVLSGGAGNFADGEHLARLVRIHRKTNPAPRDTRRAPEKKYYNETLDAVFAVNILVKGFNCVVIDHPATRRGLIPLHVLLNFLHLLL